jgi:hypothetical protein
METDREKYAINPSFFDDETLLRSIDRSTDELCRIETKLEILWEEAYRRGLTDHA